VQARLQRVRIRRGDGQEDPPHVLEPERGSGVATGAVRRGELRSSKRQTFAEAAESWLEGAKSGEILNRDRRVYKPSVIRGYEQALRDYLLPVLGRRRLADITRRDLQTLADNLRGRGLSPSTVRNAFLPARAIYRRAIRDGDVSVNPTTDLELEPVTGRREVETDVEEVLGFLEVLPDDLRALHATAFFGGLRRGELRGLRWEDVDLANGVIHVRRGWDDKDGAIDPKTRKGTRDAPIIPRLRETLVEHKLRSNWSGDEDLVFPSGRGNPFTSSNVGKRVRRIAKENGVRYFSLHPARHVYISFMHEAGFSLERIGDYVGHSSAYMTDQYRHLQRDHLAEAAKRFEDHLARQVEPTGTSTGTKVAETA
jgi:integrase